MVNYVMPTESSVIFQSAKLGDIPFIVRELDHAQALLNEISRPGVSTG